MADQRARLSCSSITGGRQQMRRSGCPDWIRIDTVAAVWPPSDALGAGPAEFQDSAVGVDQRFQAARSYSLTLTDQSSQYRSAPDPLRSRSGEG